MEKSFWFDESPFELLATANRHNDRVWAKTTKDVPLIFAVKFPLKIQVWGLMSHQALSELHIIPQGQTVDSLYYRNEILAKTCRDAINRTPNTGPISERPIENLWSILKDKINEKGQMTNRNQLIENLKFAWQDIAP